MGGFSKKTTQKEVSQSEEKKIEMEEKWKNATKRWKEKKKWRKKTRRKKKASGRWATVEKMLLRPIAVF